MKSFKYLYIPLLSLFMALSSCEKDPQSPKANTVYNAVVGLYNESVSPVDTITNEVSEEALEHQFFYTFSDMNASYIYTDLDTENHPIGIMTRVTTGEPSEGLVTIILRHLPDKFASGVSDGDISNAGGETDIEVSFLVIIE